MTFTYRLRLIEETAKEAAAKTANAAKAAEVAKADSPASPVRHVFIKGDIADKELIKDIFRQYKFDTVIISV